MGKPSGAGVMPTARFLFPGVFGGYESVTLRKGETCYFYWRF